MAKRRELDWRHAAIAASLFLAPNSAIAAERAETLVVPFEINELDHMVVDVEINGTAQSTAVLDTAATFALLDSRVARQSHVPEPAEGARTVEILGLNGVKVYPVVQIGGLKMGELSLPAMDAAYSKDLDIPGAAPNVLPSAAFPGDVLELNFEERQIRLYDGRPDRSNSGVSDAVNYETRGGLMFVEVRINGQAGVGLIDTGSNLTFVNSAFAKSAKMRPNDELTQLLQGATGGSTDVRVASARKLAIGEFNFLRAEILVADPFLLTSLGLADQPAIVIGLDYLSQFTVQFDRRRERVVLTLPEAKRSGVRLELKGNGSRIP